MAATVTVYVQTISSADQVVWNGISGDMDGWLIVVHAMCGGSVANMGGDPGSFDGGWPVGAWQLLAQADAGDGLTHMRVWATKFHDLNTRSIVLANDSRVGAESHSHLYFVAGTREGEDAAEVFSVGAAASADSVTSQELPLYGVDGTELLIGAWISGALGNFTALGGLTTRAELDGAFSTSRTGEETLSTTGPAPLTATASVAAPFSAVSIAVRQPTAGSVTFPDEPLRMKTELALGANPGQDPAFWAGLWTDITDDAQPRDGGVTIKRGRADETSTVGPSSMTVTLDNTAGRYVRLNPLGPYYGLLSKNTPMRLWVDVGDGWRLRYTGFVSEWPPRSQGGQVDENMPVRADGVTRRLSRGKVLNSALYRQILNRGGIQGYWPLETDFTSGMGGATMRTGGSLSFGSDAPPGSAGAVSSQRAGLASGPVVGMPDLAGWRVSFWLTVPEDFDVDNDFSMMVTWSTPGANLSNWVCYMNPSSPGHIIIGAFAAGDQSAVDGAVNLVGGGPYLVTAVATYDLPSTTNVVYQVDVTGIDGTTDSTSAIINDEVVAPITSVGLNTQLDMTDVNPKGSISHLMVAADADPLEFQPFGAADWLLAAGTGFTGERATARIQRLANEENIPLAIVGDDGASEPMGPQPVARFLDILRDCEGTDGGVLYERRDGRLAYQARAGRYNTTPAVTLDYAARDVAPPLEPTDDDQHLRNDYTASRPDGGSARVYDQAHIDAVGQYADSGTVNVADDTQLADQAGWRVHLGTAEGLRYPAIAPNLNARPSLIPDWANLDIGQPAALANPGRDLPPGQIDVFAEGYSEVIDTVSWAPVANCSPGAPWNVVVLGDDTHGRLDTAGSQVASSISTPTATTSIVEDFEDATLNVTVTDGGDAAWARTNTKAHTGSWSLKSGTIANNQTSDAIITVPSGKTVCTFWYWVSSEPTFDFLHVLVDATEKFAVAGESVGWQRGAVLCSGASTITFRYAKDANTATGDDAVYLDDLVFTTAETISVATTSGPLWTVDPGDMPAAITVGGEDMLTYAITGSSSPQTFTIDRAINGVVKTHDAGEDVRLTVQPTLSN